MASNEIVSEEAEEREFVTNPKNQYVAAGIVSGLASLSIGTTKKNTTWVVEFQAKGIFILYIYIEIIWRLWGKNP